MSQENSLTAPEDRDRQKGWRPESGKPPLSEEEMVDAMIALNDTTFVGKFAKVDRVYSDPAIPMQNISLFSFTPAKGATPNSNGVFGFGKIRGTYNTPQEAEERAEYIIRSTINEQTNIGSDYDIAKLTKHLVGDVYACVNIKKNLWYTISPRSITY